MSDQSSVNRDLQELATYGARGDAVRRLAWTDEHRAALDWWKERLERSGLEVELDPAGNLIGRWQVGEGRAVALGSHIDSGPNAGRYDGTLGVLGALAAVDLLRESGVQPRRPIWVISFMDEEGVRFGVSMMGSRAFTGDDVTELLECRDDDGVSIADEMRRWGLDPTATSGADRIDQIGAYLELHIEQGPVLEQEGLELGIVESIVGMIQANIRLVGEANHAGTTPMHLRHDALMGMARIALALREQAVARSATLTIGKAEVEPGAFTVIPGACEFSVDFRVGSPSEFDGLRALVSEVVEHVAADEGLEGEVTFSDADPPVELDATIVTGFESAAADLGVRHRRMPSGAGHDAMLIARHVPTGMLFVPSRGGISHSPAEFTDPRHCELGVQALARTLEALVT
jgi:hydantoinase/carbamoylase family amidase